ncbi:DUF4333 domain-containing protein [Gordonia zhaorongruii]|uniref:DUF4333 domain-containing protein n=1 Tax=Gordonia zhaorongruii TaxID=2597659 RepID=UPI001044A4EF|nr:DUF4333 domain-containing protein [Gordonia zhaorongruii]
MTNGNEPNESDQPTNPTSNDPSDGTTVPPVPPNSDPQSPDSQRSGQQNPGQQMPAGNAAPPNQMMEPGQYGQIPPEQAQTFGIGQTGAPQGPGNQNARGQPPQYGQAPQYGQLPQYGAPAYGAPAYGPSGQPNQSQQPNQYGPPAYGQPGQPHYGQPAGQYGPPQYGQPPYGQQQFGQQQFGQPGQPPYGADPAGQPFGPRATATSGSGKGKLLAIGGGVLALLAAIILITAFVWPNWAKGGLSQESVESGVQSILNQPEPDGYGIQDVKDVECPSGQDAEEGVTFTCSVSVDGANKNVTVTVKDSDGTFEVSRPTN